MQRFQKFLQGEWPELLEAEEREGRRSLSQLESPTGKASKIIGALANGNLTKAMAQLTSFGVAPTTDATVNTITEMLKPNDDRLLQGLDYLANEPGRSLTLREVTHLRMMGRGKAKDVAGWAPENLCVVRGHPDLGKELTNFFNHFIQGNLCEGTQRALMQQTVTPLNKGTNGKLRPLGCAATFAESPTAHSSVPKQRTSQRYSDRHSTQLDGRQRWNRSQETPRRRSKQNATLPWLNSIAARHSTTRTARRFCLTFATCPRTLHALSTTSFRASRSIWFVMKTVAQCWSPRTMVSPRVVQHHPQLSPSSFCWWRNSSGQSS